MPPKAIQQVVADSTDPATTRPNLDPVIKTGSGFILMDLPPFHSRVNLLPHIKPIDAWEIFLLFFPEDQIRIIYNNTNSRKEREYQERFESNKRPITLAEAYRYIGIRIYIGIHKENKARGYWKPGDLAWPDHALTAVMSLRRFEALHTSFRLCTSDPDHDFEAVFDRVPQPKALGTNTSSAIVAHLIERLPNQGKGNIVYLNNLFTNIKLLRYGRERGWGATGTCTAKSGILKRFSQMKAEDAKKDEIPWGTLYTEATEDNLINIIAWKDNALVLSMSTHSDAQRKIKRLRRRPSETSTLVKTARVPFGKHARAWLDIPEYENDYNHQMGAVDRGNQLKKPNSMQRICKMGGQQSLVTWTEDTAITNAYKLSYHSEVPEGERWTDQTEFRTELVRRCFAFTRESHRKRKRSEIFVVNEAEGGGEHTLKRIEYSREYVIYLKEGVSRAVKRKILKELSTNIPPNVKGSGCKKKSIFGCKVCIVSLCKDNTCFTRYHSTE
ncbi:hypothetical protein DL98DRAFT_511305 [Cadophora sp. DSE1049]|nr:hypothetical protein DL98DRAFT_511305 [Cadophora sp. DSE1049]